MTRFVIDSSAALRFDHWESRDATYFAPELIDVEIANALRKLVLRGEAQAHDAENLIRDWARNSVVRTPHATLIERVWELRANITPYDATYVALAETMRIPLVTADLRLARTASRFCRVVTLT
ncbi:type II toxin-antitoxin system VapC family toxin [Schumannella luteola]|jgi:predicted nucleic acid-binding protein